MKRYSLGALKLYHLSFGRFKLDGGAMFGVVPKPLWERLHKADIKNRITLGMNPLIVQSDSFTLIIDTGCGNHFTEKEYNIYDIHIKENPFKGIDLSPEDVTHCILTHLHFDHAGGSTVKKLDEIVPSFSNATYYVQEDELKCALEPNERTRASYKRESFVPLLDKSRLVTVKGNKEVLPGISVIQTGGHTKGHQIVLIESQGEKALYFADLVPTSAHIPLPYIMGYDLFPEKTLAMRKKFYEMAIKEEWLLVFEHDPVPKAGFLSRDNKNRYILK